MGLFMSQELKVTIPPTQADSAWKDALDLWFREFMEFFYPELAKKIDWLAGYESLDKELQMIINQAMLGKRNVDKLMKVKSLEGEEFWVLAHTEIQGKKETGFEKRLFEYYYRLHDRYNMPIVTLAVLADKNRSWRPSVYKEKVWGTEVLSFQFFPVKLLDYEDRQAYLEQTTNPFGVIVLAQLAALKTRKNFDARFNAKLSLTRQLYERGLDRDAILSLYKFIDWVMTLPEDLEVRYNERLYQLEEERTVAYITSAERIGMKKGYEQGMEKGLAHERGLFNRLLTRRFGDLSLDIMCKLSQATHETLLLWGEKIFDAKTIEDVFAE
jgi:hypothetical protein